MANGVGVCTTNYLDTATMTKSSEKTAYPASNVLDIQRRKKVWRTDGYWLIESGSNTIVFREFTGVDLTATITPGEYTTTALMTAIVTALEAAGACAYTAEWLTSGKVKITSDTTLGDVTEFRFATSTAMADILGFDAANISGVEGDPGFFSVTADEVRLHTSEWLVFDFGIPTNPKAFALVGDRANQLRISETATIKLQASPTNSWASPAFEMTISHSDFALSAWDFEGLADVDAGYRYWRFLIIDRDNPRLYLEFGAAFLGEMLNMERGCVVYPLGLRGVDSSINVVSEGGQVYGLERPKTVMINLEWRALNVTEEESLWEHWETVGITRNWFLILDAQEAFSTRARDRVKLVRFDQAHAETLFKFKNFQASWTLLEAM